jgi:hypothetical protein
MPPTIEALFASQDQLITRKQALQHLTEDELRRLLGSHWRIVLPGIYASTTAELSYRQRVRAALVYVGATGQVADATALFAHKIPYLPTDRHVRVLVSEEVQRSSRDFVIIRRTSRLPQPVLVGGMPTVPIDRALCEFVARHPDWREAFAVIAAAVQQRRVSVTALYEEALRGPARGRARLTRALEPLRAGVRSLPESDFRQLVLQRRGLPEPLWNCLLVLPDGRRFSPDALFVDARLVHEVNGRDSHSAELAGEDRFEDMQRRSDGLVTAGFTVLGNTPRRLRTEPRAVIGEVADCYHQGKGRGLPPGVRIVRSGPPDGPSAPSGVTPLGHDDGCRAETEPAA